MKECRQIDDFRRNDIQFCSFQVGTQLFDYNFKCVLYLQYFQDCDMTYAHFCKPNFWEFWHPGSSPGDHDKYCIWDLFKLENQELHLKSLITFYSTFFYCLSLSQIHYHLIRISLAGSWGSYFIAFGKDTIMLKIKAISND